MLHSLANDWIFSTELWPTETKNRLNSSATVLLSLLKIRWDVHHSKGQKPFKVLLLFYVTTPVHCMCPHHISRGTHFIIKTGVFYWKIHLS